MVATPPPSLCARISSLSRCHAGSASGYRLSRRPFRRIGAMIIQPDSETLLAVILGAALATAGGFSERQLERLIQRREKERSAALMFGEILNAIRIIMSLADEARGRGDPYGPITLRFIRGAKREVEIYDRTRETLLDLRD